jgi:hypothetical protein
MMPPASIEMVMIDRNERERMYENSISQIFYVPHSDRVVNTYSRLQYLKLQGILSMRFYFNHKIYVQAIQNLVYLVIYAFSMLQ